MSTVELLSAANAEQLYIKKTEAAEYLADAFPTSEASGAIASFPDGADNIPLKSCVVNIEPVQAGSGDPSPDNVRTISGWTGCNIVSTNKNLCRPADASYSDGVTVTVQPDGGVRIVGTSSTMHGAPLINYFGVDAINLKPGRYKISLTGSGTGFDDLAASASVGIQVYIDGSSAAIAKDSTVTVPETVSTQSYARLRIAANVTFDCVVYPLVYRVDGNNDDTWEAPVTATYPITFGSAGTVYGGYVDVTKGELVVTHKKRAISEGGWTHNTQYEFYYTNTITDRKMGSPVLASCYNYVGVKGDSAMNSLETGSIAIGSSSTRTIKIKDTRYTTTADFTASDGYFIYELETPIEFQLPSTTTIPTLYGLNNLWADSGDVSVTYRADPTMYIDGQIAPIKAMVASEETGATASQAYTAGQYFILDGQFCKALTNIASGATFTLGTNYQTTTIGAELYSALHS